MRLRRHPAPASKVHRAIVVAAVGGAVCASVEAIAKLHAGPRPSLENASALVAYMLASEIPMLIVVLADTLLMAALLVFFTCLRALIKRHSAKPEWASDIGLGSILIYIAITLVGDSMDGGTVLDTTLSAGDATVIRTLIESHILLFGPIGSVVIALGVGMFGYALYVSRVTARWNAVFAYIVAGINVVAIMVVFRKIGSVAYGTEVTLAALVAFIAWVLITGIVVFIAKQKDSRRSLL